VVGSGTGLICFDVNAVAPVVLCSQTFQCLVQAFTILTMYFA